LLSAFATLAKAEGTVASGVYFPANSEADFPESSNVLGRSLLALADMPFVDLTECLRIVERDKRTVPGGNHLTGLANKAAAQFVAPYLKKVLSELVPMDRDLASANIP
jgi:hypothetical protein